MPTYIEFTMEDGSTVLVESESSAGAVVRSSRGGGYDIIQTGKRFTDALVSIRGTLKAIISEMDALKIEEAEVKFGLKALGEAGVFAVGKVGGEMNYEVTLKWKKPVEKKAVEENK
jgi:hypothetical protein